VGIELSEKKILSKLYFILVGLQFAIFIFRVWSRNTQFRFHVIKFRDCLSHISCFSMYREVFFVDEPVLMVPKLYVNLPTCLLRVVDNDSGEELTRVFQKVAPNNLKKNKVLFHLNFPQTERQNNEKLPIETEKLRSSIFKLHSPLSSQC